VHAEHNALLSAARFGIAVEGGTVYTTMRPCFGCTKELLQARIKSVFFIHEWSHPDQARQAHYLLLQSRFPDGIRQLSIDDPHADWAVSNRRVQSPALTDEIGHGLT
jgi:dCMP deaminase